MTKGVEELSCKKRHCKLEQQEQHKKLRKAERDRKD